MKTESKVIFLRLLYGWLKKSRNAIVAVLYFLAAHAYDGVCFAVSNTFSYFQALAIMSTGLFLVSMILVVMHNLVKKHFSWDMLGLEDLNNLRGRDNIPSRSIFKRLLRWSMRKGHWWFHVIGSLIVGPPIVTPILQRKGSLMSSLFYLSTGTAMSALVWVTVSSGVGKLTWNQYVVPLYEKIF